MCIRNICFPFHCFAYERSYKHDYNECSVLIQVKEKAIAARRSGITTIIFPEANRRDFDELAPNVKEGLEVHFVENYDQIYDLAFAPNHETKEQVQF